MTKSPGKKSPSLSALIAKANLLTIFFDGTIGSAASRENGTVQIKVDQVGYLPRASKLAMVNATTATTFELKRAGFCAGGRAPLMENAGRVGGKSSDGDKLQTDRAKVPGGAAGNPNRGAPCRCMPSI